VTSLVGADVHQRIVAPAGKSAVKIVVETDPNLISAFGDLLTARPDYVIPQGRAVTGMPRRNQPFHDFATSLGGVRVNTVFFHVTVQNLADGAVSLENMRVAALKCAAPLKGTRISFEPGAEAAPPRAMMIDLDARSPKPWYFPAGIPQPRSSAKRGVWHELPPGTPPKGSERFGFTVPKDGTEKFDGLAFVAHRSCQFTLVIDAVINGKPVEEPITDHGKPFRVTGDLDQQKIMWTGFKWTSPDLRLTYPPGQPLPETDP
jgi:hypothetical protein